MEGLVPRSSALMCLVLLSVLIVGAAQTQPQSNAQSAGSFSQNLGQGVFVPSGYNSPNITVVLITPANQSTVVGNLTMTLNITSVNGPLNLTLFVDSVTYPAYNQTLIGTGLQNVTVSTTTLRDGNRNFTLFFETNAVQPVERESYHLVFLVNNHGPPSIAFISPAYNGTFTGMGDLFLNITSDYSQVNLTIRVDGAIAKEFNATAVPVGAANYVINGSRYDNGLHTVNATVVTEEGLKASVSRVLYFLDYVRFAVTDLTAYSTIRGNQSITIRIFTPFPNVTFSAYVDYVLVPYISNVTLPKGTATVTINTTIYSEGNHNFTFKAYGNGTYVWIHTMLLTVDNHGLPSVAFAAVRTDVVVGLATFTVDITSDWHTVNLTVYVDGVAVSGLINVTADAGVYSFQFDVGNYTKWQHTLKVVVITPEGLEAQTERMFGFASVRPEEIVSLVVLLGLAAAIPIVRSKQGKPVKDVIIVDVVFALVVVVLFAALGVTSYALLVWHLNLASIWALGTALVFANWVLPIVTEGSGEE
ncbi:MAG: hypothetical protein C4K47_02160 [Candidatus Thorarchaeota archaeon]|nr:MAG: hypothetical protein C4K47_02160 [Candidatus Thorarchaeota archaeon]